MAGGSVDGSVAHFAGGAHSGTQSGTQSGTALGYAGDLERAAPDVGHEPRYRPKSGPARLAAMLSPGGLAAGQVAMERAARLRVDRLVAAASDRLREWWRPSRARMRALVVSGGGRLTWRDVPVPLAPGPLGALVRPIAAATCDLDRPLALGATAFPLPLTIGHECVAEVLEVGEHVTSVRVGQRVCVPFQINCGRCAPCRAGLTGNCVDVPPFSMYGFGVVGGHWGGMVADQVAVPYADAMLVPLPDGVDPVAAASVSDTTCDGYRQVAPHLPELLRRDSDAEVLIIAGLTRRPMFSASVPLYAGQVALALGARRVRLVDSRPSVRRAATRLGIEPLRPKELRRVRPAPLVVAASATAKGMWAALSRTAPDGVCSSVGGLHRVGRVPVVRGFARNVSFYLGRTHARALMPEVLELIAQGRFRPERVISTLGDWEEAPRLLGRHYRGSDVKTVLHRS